MNLLSVDSLLDLVNDNLLVRDAAGRITHWSKGCETLYGFPKSKAVGAKAHELLRTVYPASEERIDAVLEKHASWQGGLRQTHAAGHEIVVRAQWTKSGDSIVERLEPVEVKTAEEGLDPSEYRYRNLFQAMAASFWELDFRPAGDMLRKLRKSGVTDFRRHFEENPGYVRELMRVTRIVDVNETTVSMYGASDRAQLFFTLDTYWPESSTHVFAESVLAALSGAPNYATETRLRRTSGEDFDVLFTVCFPPGTVANGNLLVGVIDISERVRAQGALQKLQDDFVHAARVSMLGELTASLAHEINQPLSAITANAAASLRWLARENPDEAAGCTKRIVDDSRRAAEIIRRIHGMASRRAPERAFVSINDVVKESLLFIRHELRAKGVAISTNLVDGRADVLGDRTQLQQVMVNLSMNAIQAMHASEAKRLAISTTLAGAAVTVTVDDTGPGVERGEHQKLFESFYTTKPDGLGMGLPICKSILEAHGGTIGIDTSPFGGARFSFALPTAVPS